MGDGTQPSAWLRPWSCCPPHPRYKHGSWLPAAFLRRLLQDTEYGGEQEGWTRPGNVPFSWPSPPLTRSPNNSAPDLLIPVGAPPVPESRVGGGACWCVGLACRCRAWILPFLPLVQVSPVCLSPALQNVSSGCRVLGEGLPRHRLGRVGGGAEAQRWALSSSSCFSLFLLILRSVSSPFQ